MLLEHGRRIGGLGYPVGADDWLFPSRNRKLKQPSSLVTAIRESAKTAGLTKRVAAATLEGYLVGAGDRARTGDSLLGKQVLYQLSYARELR